GCGLGNLAVAAARQGCAVLALDASPTAIAHLRESARSTGLSIEAAEEDLRSYQLQGEFDTVVSIGLLMFLDCPTALRKLQELQDHLRPGGVAVINVLEEGTTYLDMFDPSGHCLFTPEELAAHFGGWDILQLAHQDFPAPGGKVKRFATLIARKPRDGAHADVAVM
ncbi:methyltransferase domain-containing protein, partial [Polaromonas sp. YR568]|uniref:methyltransferase domain-containing protein n=1 Tax=Polaromonas sp. YR568 TaxID=1855301 RepID=UPI003137BDA6